MARRARIFLVRRTRDNLSVVFARRASRVGTHGLGTLEAVSERVNRISIKNIEESEARGEDFYEIRNVSFRHWYTRNWDDDRNLIPTDIRLHYLLTVGAVMDEINKIIGFTLEEEVVDGYWEDERLLNMIPGGRKGLRYLHEHNMIGRNVHPLPDEVDRILENWFKENPRKGLPAPWVAEKWEDPAYAESVICGADGRLKPDQVRAIRYLSATGLEPEVILQKVGALNLPQVSRVLTGQSYSRIT